MGASPSFNFAPLLYVFLGVLVVAAILLTVAAVLHGGWLIPVAVVFDLAVAILVLPWMKT